MKGNVFDHSYTPTAPTGEELSDHSESERALVQLIQLKVVNLVSALMSMCLRMTMLRTIMQIECHTCGIFSSIL
jgi:hypothetical protein